MGVTGFRKRYIAFRIDAPRNVERWELIKVLQNKAMELGMAGEGQARPWLTVYKDNRGIMRCSHVDKDKAIELLVSVTELGEDNIQVKLETIVTSGTIKQAKAKGSIE